MELQTIISTIIAVGGALATVGIVLLRFGSKETSIAMKIEALEKTDTKQGGVLERLDRNQTLTEGVITAIKKQQEDDGNKHAHEITNLREAMAASEGRIVEAISDVKADIRALRGEDKKPPRKRS